jgi:DNA-binding GntR family transcriptional regulator
MKALPSLSSKAVKSGAARVPVREQTINILREAILNSELKPGQRLVEREFIDRLGISRTTFREVLRQLSAEGLVKVVPQKGATVSAPSLKEAEDLYVIRAALESLAVSRFIERASPSETRALRESIENFERVVEQTTDTTEMLDAKEQFYGILLLGARSEILEETLRGIKARVRTLRAKSLSKPGRAQETVAELRAIMDAVSEDDAVLASELCTRHVLKAGEVAISRIKEMQATYE